MPDPNSTAYLVEEVFKESCLAKCRTENIDHFHSDEPHGWPLVSIKATLAEEDATEIKHEGEPCEVFNVYIVAEWPITDEQDGVKISALELDRLAREITEAVRAAGDTQAIELFSYFDTNPLAEAEQDVEEDSQETPTRRVTITSLQVYVIRAVALP